MAQVWVAFSSVVEQVPLAVSIVTVMAGSLGCGEATLERVATLNETVARTIRLRGGNRIQRAAEAEIENYADEVMAIG